MGPLVLWTLEGNEGLIKAVRLPVGLFPAPVAGVAGQAVNEFMVAPILRDLVAVVLSVTFTEAGSVEKGQAQGAVVRLIRAVLAVRKHSHAVSATSVGEIEPLVRGNFVLLGVVVASLNRADIPVVGSLRIRSGRGEGSLEGGLAGLPVDDKIGRAHV